MEKNPYQILNVDPEAVQATINAAYERLAQQYGPEADSGEAAAERWEDIQWAFHTLQDPFKRADIDRLLYPDQYGDDLQSKTQSNQRRTNIILIAGGVGLLVGVVCCVGLFCYSIFARVLAVSQVNTYPPIRGNPIRIMTPLPLYGTDYDQAGTATAQVESAFASAAEGEEWPLVISETFTQPDPGWFMGEEEGSEFSIQTALHGEKYLWALDSDVKTIWHTHPNMEPVGDFYLTVEVEFSAVSKSSGCGAVFRLDEGGNYYYFHIDGSRAYEFGIQYNQEWISILSPTFSTWIKPEESNRITILAQGDMFTFFINDHYVAQVEDSRLIEGLAGLGASPGGSGEHMVVEFDNFELRVPEE